MTACMLAMLYRSSSPGMILDTHTRLVGLTYYRWLQEVFDAPLVIMLTDDEKFLHSPKLKVEDVKRFTRQNAKDIIAVGFDLKKTFIFADFDYVKGALYENAIQIARRTTINQIKGTFGFDDR